MRSFSTIATFTTYFHKQYLSTIAKLQTPAVARPFPPFLIGKCSANIGQPQNEAIFMQFNFRFWKSVTEHIFKNRLFPVNIYLIMSLSNLIHTRRNDDALMEISVYLVSVLKR